MNNDVIVIYGPTAVGKSAIAVELAKIAHDEEKQKAIVVIANEYKDKIPNRLYEALISWKPDYQKYA